MTRPQSSYPGVNPWRGSAGVTPREYPRYGNATGLIMIRLVLLMVLAFGGWSFSRVARNVYTCYRLDLDEPIRHLQPVTVTDVNGENRVLSGPAWLNISEVPPALIAALVDSEDRRFFERDGAIDARAIARAVWAIVRGHREGASTLQMQAVRSVYELPGGNFAKSAQRKLLEMIVAVRMDHHYTREQILEIYLNAANFAGVRGLEGAALKYFGKRPKDLSPVQYYWLIGTLPSPTSRSKRDKAHEVVNTIIRKYQKMGVMDEGVTLPPSKPFPWGKPRRSSDSLPPGLQAEIERAAGAELLGRAREIGGADISVTLDFKLQHRLQIALSGWIARLAPEVAPGSEKDVDGAGIVIDATTGRVLACVGSRNADRPWSCATQSLRPTGSNIKGPILASAYEEGVTNSDELIEDAPLKPQVVKGMPTNKPWPANADGRYLGFLIPQEAFALSRNPIFVLLGDRSRKTLDSFLRGTHMGSVVPGNPAQFLGTAPVSLIHLAAAYATFLDGGIYH